jgi:hypothetical protein
MNCLNTIGSGIHLQIKDTLHKNGFIDGTSTSWTATITGLMTLKVVGGGGKGGKGGSVGSDNAGGGGGGGGGSGYVNTQTNYEIVKGTVYDVKVGKVPASDDSSPGGTSIFNDAIYAWGGGNGGNGGPGHLEISSGGGGTVLLTQDLVEVVVEVVVQINLEKMEQMLLLITHLEDVVLAGQAEIVQVKVDQKVSLVMVVMAVEEVLVVREEIIRLLLMVVAVEFRMVEMELLEPVGLLVEMDT